MKIDGLDLPASATVKGLVPSVTEFPSFPSAGNSVNLTQEYAGRSPGIYTYLNDWEPLGDITAVVAGTGLSGGGASGAINLSIDTSLVAMKTDLSAFLDKAHADQLYQPIGSTVDLSAYLKKTDADSAYAKKTDLSSYVTGTALNTALQSYVSGTSLTTTLQGYVQNSALTTTLQNYVTASTLDSYAKTTALAPLATSAGWGLKKDANGKFTVDSTATPYDVGSASSGMPSSGAVLLTFEAVRAFTIPKDFSGSVASAAANSTNTTVFSVAQNGTVIGTFTFAAGANTATFSTTSAAINFAAGDVLTVVAPNTPDASLSDLRFTVAANLQS